MENPLSTLFSSSIEFSTMELILLYSASIAMSHNCTTVHDALCTTVYRAVRCSLTILLWNLGHLPLTPHQRGWVIGKLCAKIGFKQFNSDFSFDSCKVLLKNTSFDASIIIIVIKILCKNCNVVFKNTLRMELI